MEKSLILAKMFGLYMLIVAIAMLINPKSTRAYVDNILVNPAVSYLVAIIALILGVILVVFHNVWTGSAWVIIVTVLCWMTLLKGVIYLFFPSALEKMVGYFKKDSAYYTSAIITVLLGAYLIYVGFFS